METSTACAIDDVPAVNTMPDSASVSGPDCDACPRARAPNVARAMTATAATAAPTSDSNTYPSRFETPHHVMPMTTASAEPALMPRMPGSASGLRVMPCIAVPAIATAAPTMMPMAVRSPREASSAETSPPWNEPAPTVSETATANASSSGSVRPPASTRRASMRGVRRWSVPARGAAGVDIVTLSSGTTIRPARHTVARWQPGEPSNEPTLRPSSRPRRASAGRCRSRRGSTAASGWPSSRTPSGRSARGSCPS